MTEIADCLQNWARKVAEWVEPSHICWIDGSDEQANEIARDLEKSGRFIPCNPATIQTATFTAAIPGTLLAQRRAR